MELILAGSWLSEKGFYTAKIKSVETYGSIAELPENPGLSFILLSYSLARETLGVPVKRDDKPPVVLLKIKDFSPLNWEPPSAVSLKHLGNSLKDNEFVERILRIKEYIARGDVYQINLTNRLDFQLRGNPKDLFMNFYKKQPVYFGFFLNLEDFFVISGSMELFLEKEGKLLRSKPIKGTGSSPEEILSSPKERAENLMITDMVRNDIGRVAVFGTVRVEELFKVERFRTLYQMHSTVVGKTTKGLKEILLNTFPPASVTGAPKKRAVEIIDELEPHPRSYYCGAAGLIFPNGDFRLSVLIRTAVGKGDRLSYYAGCGIVWDSEPEKELREMYLKVKAFCELR
ncbi:chorismate-binding protein [Aquifex sp.]